MDTKIKNYLGTSVVIVLFIFAYAAFSYTRSFSRSIEPSAFRSFSASGEGKVVAIPDVAQFTFSVITQGGKDISLLMKENTEKVNKAIGFLKSEGIEAKDIKTQNYNLEPRYEHFICPVGIQIGVGAGEKPRSCPPPEIAGYTITQTVSVKIRDFVKIGGLLSGVIKNGANNVSQLSFTIDDPAELENQAREEAISKAKEKAKAVAKAGGFKLGRLLSIDEGFVSPFRFQAKGAGFGGEFSAPSAPVIEPGSQEITVNITLRYEIE